jgi:CheY-like chemotaxis protein
MGGRIWVDSEPGKGSRFHFIVSAGMADDEAARAPVPAHLAGTHVLVVDDNDASRRILGSMVERWGMRPTLVASGAQALARLRDSTGDTPPFGLFLVDARMPGIDGVDLVRQFRQRVDLRGIPVVLLTSPGRAEEPGPARDPCFATSVSKPVVEPRLLSAVTQALHAHRRVAAETGSADLGPVHRGPRLRILLAEDNPVNQVLATRLIEKVGHAVEVVGDGRQAVDALDRREFDLVIMDVSMPEMSGFEALRIIREREKISGMHVPIIAMTAHAMQGDRERCLAAGMDGYVSKPIDPQNLFAAIEALRPTSTTADVRGRAKSR